LGKSLNILRGITIPLSLERMRDPYTEDLSFEKIAHIC
jgi:hypothetical protein